MCSNFLDILLLSRLSISDSSLSPVSLSSSTFHSTSMSLWPAWSTNAQCLLEWPEIFCSPPHHEETLNGLISVVPALKAHFVPQCCVSWGHGCPGVGPAVVTRVTFLHNYCQQLCSSDPVTVNTMTHSVVIPALPTLSHKSITVSHVWVPIPHLTVMWRRQGRNFSTLDELWSWVGPLSVCGDWHMLKYDARLEIPQPSSRYGQTRKCFTSPKMFL